MMSLFGRFRQIFAARETSEPSYPDRHRVPYVFRSLAGPVVTPDTAITVPAVWACLRYVSQTVASLPWRVMQETQKGGELKSSHPIDNLLNKRPSAEWSAFQFRETMVHWALRWGNGYAEIERDQLGRPFALWPIHPERVLPRRDIENGKLVFEVSNGTKGKVIVDAMDMFHLRGFGEGPIGVNVMQYAAESIGWAKAAQLFGAAFFGNGMTVNGIIQQKTALKPEGLARFKEELKNLFKGVRRAFDVIVLDNGAEFKQVQVDPDKGQFLETQEHLVLEICRWFGVPPHKVAALDRATHSNIESQTVEVVVDCVVPWVKRLEEEADFKLFGQNRQAFYSKIMLAALLRGDAAARAALYKTMWETGAFSANMILAGEDMNQIGPEGDKHLVQANLTTLQQIGAAPIALPAPGTAADPDATEENAEPAPDDEQAERTAKAALMVWANELDFVDG